MSGRGCGSVPPAVTDSRPFRVPLPGALAGAEAALLLRGDAHPRALVGDWAGVTAILASEPVEVPGPGADPFGLLTGPIGDATAAAAESPRIGGGWIGALGYRLAGTVEPVPPAPPAPVALPRHTLARYDHVVVRDADGRWWFEALPTPGRARALEARLALWRDRLAGGAPAPRPYSAGPLAVTGPGAAGHLAAVAEGRERIAAGEVFQVNLCLRLEGPWAAGEPLDLFARAASELRPRHAAFAEGPWGAVASLSPERFLRRAGREVLTEPVKGTGADPVALAASAKDRAENVMIADLMRNDLGRVCAFGSVRTGALAEPRPAPGVWHLVSEVRGTLRDDAGDDALLRACFPPGSCTGAPKVRAMRVIHELESSARETYTGAIGLVSPLAGLDLNVAIRTFEVCAGRIWLGAGGGIVSDSVPEDELGEALAKAAGPARAAGLEITAADPPAVTLLPPAALTGDARRPNPDAGLLETLLVRDGEPQQVEAHAARLAASARALGWPRPPGLQARVASACRRVGHGRARVILRPGREPEIIAAPEPPPAGVVELHPFTLPGGLGAHKWADRVLLDELAARCGGAPLLVDADGAVLEAAWANVATPDGRTPPADGRLLPGVTRARALAAGLLREAPLTLGDLDRGAVLLSAVGGPRPARLSGGRAPASLALCADLRRALGFPPAGTAAIVGHTP